MTLKQKQILNYYGLHGKEATAQIMVINGIVESLEKAYEMIEEVLTNKEQS